MRGLLSPVSGRCVKTAVIVFSILFAADSENGAESDRLVRMGVTLGASALATAAPLLIGWQVAEGNCRATGACADWPVTAAVAVLPFTIGLGLGLPHYLMKGRAGFGFGLAGALVGYMAGAAIMSLVSLAMSARWTERALLPGALLIAGLGTVGGVGALEWRDSALSNGAEGWELGRPLVATLAFLFPSLLGELGVLALASSLNYAGGSTTPTLTALVAGSIVNALLGSVSAWGAHRLMGGRAPVWVALAGLVVGAAVAGAFLGVHARDPGFSGLSFNAGPTIPVPLFSFAGAIVLLAPGLAMEWSTARQSDSTLRLKQDESDAAEAR